MKTPRIWAGAVVCLLAAMASATTYYVDGSGGDDTKDGQTVATAWKTIAKVNAGSFSAGDQILFKRGEVWRESLVPPSSGASGNPIRFDAYGTGDAPTITGYQDLTASSWMLDSGNIWKATVTSSSLNYVLFGSIWGQKQSGWKTACTAPYYFYFASNVLYVFSVGNPASYYGSVAAMLMTNGQLVHISGRSWLEFQHFKLTYYDAYGVRIAGASDHITVANVYADGIIPAGTMPHGFYVSASPAPTDISFYNVDAHRNYDGLRLDGSATLIRVKNCRAYANRNKGLEDNTGGANYSFCHFYGNGLGVLVSTDATGGTDGGNNVPAYTAPQIGAFQRYPARITLTVDDPGLIDGAENYVDSILPTLDARGTPLGIAIVTGYAISNSLVPKFQSWINTGRDVTSHSWSHQYFTNLNGFAIRYTGTGTAATMTISGNLLTTTVAGGPGGENLSFDLSNASYDTISKLVATINGRGGYVATQDASCQGAVHSVGLADVAAQNIKTNYTALLQKDRLMPDELAASKAWMSANLTGLPANRVYVYPGGVEDSTTQGWAAAAGYAGARGAFTMDLGTKDVYGRGVNIQNITSFGANPLLRGLTAQEMDARIASVLFKSQVWGAPYGLFWHKDELTATEVGNLADALNAHGAMLMTNTQLVNWLNGTSQVAGTTNYVSPATGEETDFRPTIGSPVVNAGTDLGSSYKFDLMGLDQTWMGSAWEMGAYSYVPQAGYLIVVH